MTIQTNQQIKNTKCSLCHYASVNSCNPTLETRFIPFCHKNIHFLRLAKESNISFFESIWQKHLLPTPLHLHTSPTPLQYLQINTFPSFNDQNKNRDCIPPLLSPPLFRRLHNRNVRFSNHIFLRLVLESNIHVGFRFIYVFSAFGQSFLCFWCCSKF